MKPFFILFGAIALMPSAVLADSIAVKPSLDSLSATTPKAPERKVTPIQNTDNLTPKPILHYYDQHGKPLKEPVAVWVEEDTVKVDRAPKAPLFNGVTVGVNFFDAILRIAGQSYANYNVSGTVDLHNWFFPTLELGLGFADATPKDKNYHYKNNASLFTRIGIDYNFLYNSNPDYKALFGLRCGFSSFSYDITDVTIPNDYWNKEPDRPALPKQKANAFWGEVSAGLQVKIWRNISMGWAFRYKFRFHTSDSANSSPWFIPGFGARNAPLSATFSISYTFGNRYQPPCDTCK